MRPALLLAMVLLAAGCTANDAAPKTSAASLQPRAPVEFGPDEAALIGLAVDEEFQPLSGARVFLIGSGTTRNETTDAQGRFQFNHVAAGLYTLGLTHPGHENVGRGLTLEAGRAIEVTLVVPRLPPETVPYVHVVPEWRGYIACSVGFWSVSTVDQCSPVDSNANATRSVILRKHLNAIHWQLSWSPSATLSARFLSVAWPSPAGLGSIPSNVEPEKHWSTGCNAKGSSPIRLTCHLRQNKTNPLWDDESNTAQMQVRAVGNSSTPNAATIGTWINQHSGPVLQQRFYGYVSLFYGGYEVPPGYNNGPDA